MRAATNAYGINTQLVKCRTMLSTILCAIVCLGRQHRSITPEVGGDITADLARYSGLICDMLDDVRRVAASDIDSWVYDIFSNHCVGRYTRDLERAYSILDECNDKVDDYVYDFSV